LTKAPWCFFKPSPLLSESDSIGRKRAFSPQKYANMAEKRPFLFDFNSKKRHFSVFIGVAEDFTLAVFLASPAEK
jgi:hypothetical protein